MPSTTGPTEMTTGDTGLVGQRLSDEPIYLEENRYDDPKESFKLLRRLIGELPPPAGTHLLDVGCATGELLFYLHRSFPDFALHGIDTSPALLERAREMVPNATFSVGRLEDPAAARADAYDLCTLSGVMCCLDDPAPALDNVLGWLRPGGTALIFDAFNEAAVDVIVRYRRAEKAGAPWETGWNIFARDSIRRHLDRDGRASWWRYEPFRMPFAIPQRPDPMRTYTIATERNPFQLVNGASQLVDLSVLVIRKRD